MAGKLAIDFGTSNTVLALWDESKKQAFPLHLPEFGRAYPQGTDSISMIPSLIHYTEDNRRWIGQQVIQRDLYHSRRTFRWMKRYISQRSPIKVLLEGKTITPFNAGKDFLSLVLLFAAQQCNLQDEEIALTVPVESFEHYEDWLGSVSEAAGLSRFRLIDEPSAAALGYGAHIQPGNVYMIFDFGGGTLHASVVLVEAEMSAAVGRRCRVLGKAGKYIGGTSIDQWIFQEVLVRNNRMDYEDSVRSLSNHLLVECERAKEKLSICEDTEVHVRLPNSTQQLSASLTRADFEDILDRHDLFTEIGRTLRAAINDSRERGYDEDAIQAVLMVGGSCAIPAVQRTIRQMFGKERVFYDRPLDAVARGGAAFIAGVDFYDHIQHNYAIRFVNAQTGSYEYRIIVKRGTAYPTLQPVAKLVLKAAYEGQKQLGLAIFEIGEQLSAASQGVELVFDPGGAARLAQVTPHEQEQRHLFWMNENQPTFLAAEPPARLGEPRFEVEFRIDGNKRLIYSARDLTTGQLIQHDQPVVKLT